MRTIDQFNFKNKKAIIRVDFNVPLDIEIKMGCDWLNLEDITN